MAGDILSRVSRTNTLLGTHLPDAIQETAFNQHVTYTPNYPGRQYLLTYCNKKYNCIYFCHISGSLTLRCNYIIVISVEAKVKCSLWLSEKRASNLILICNIDLSVKNTRSWKKCVMSDITTVFEYLL
jgi:hypothetical protein